jgi:hypothetical protein
LPFPKSTQERKEQQNRIRQSLREDEEDQILAALEASIWGDAPLPQWYLERRERERKAEEEAQKSPPPKLL